MKAKFRKKARIFNVSGANIHDFGQIHLDENEMISLLSDAGKVIDITAKVWGYYLGTSLNVRLAEEGYKTALVINKKNKLFVMVVDIDKIEKFKTYLKDNQDNRILCWLDEWFRDEM